MALSMANGVKRSVLTGLVAVAASLGLAGPAPADEIKLTFVTLNSPRAHLNVRIHHPWAAKINKEANGLFKIDVRDGMAMANHGNVYSRVLDDVAQIGWGLQVYSAGKFPLTNVVTLPFLSDRSEVASTAFWRLYKTGLLDKEYDQVVPLKLIVFPQSGVQYREKPKTLDGFEGLKIIAGSRVSSEIVQALGGAPISLRVNEYYEGLQRGTADGVVVGWTAFQPFKLAEVTHYHVETQLGTSPGFVFMTRKKLELAAGEGARDPHGQRHREGKPRVRPLLGRGRGRGPCHDHEDERPRNPQAQQRAAEKLAGARLADHRELGEGDARRREGAGHVSRLADEGRRIDVNRSGGGECPRRRPVRMAARVA